MTFERLLAKSSSTPDNPRYPETLEGHLAHVGRVAAQVVEDRGGAILEALGLQRSDWEPLLAAAAIRGALLHDIGKANDQFQRMVRHQSRLPQALKHETIGLWMLTQFPALERWLFDGQPEIVRSAAIRAIISHHLRFEADTALRPVAAGATSMDVFASHTDFSCALNKIAQILALAPPPELEDRALSLVSGDINAVDAVLLDLARRWRPGSDEARFAAAVGALVVAADVTGSIVVRSGVDPAAWAHDALGNTCDGADLGAAAARRLGGARPRPFQRAVADSRGHLTLAMAGCGSGKTVAAYLWGEQHLIARKFFYCYPTTGTATEGYIDYALPEFDHDAALVHSRAAFDIDQILDNGRDDESDSAQGRALKYRGLEMWGAKLTVCTADAVLGLTQNNRLGLFGFPAIAGAGFVFDEVHLYDDRMFGSLLAFLEAMRGAPVLLMTATLQPGRLVALRTLADRLGTGLDEIAGPTELEELSRYRVERATHDEAWRYAEREAKGGGRVLWVANTVDRAIAVARNAEQRGIRVEPYHSRYRYMERVQRHRAVIDGFRRGGTAEGVLAVTTQVCEVSLDISATLLVSELAPPSSLIQRLGRLNRWATPGASMPAPACVIDPPNHLPYAAVELEAGKTWLASVIGRCTSQAELHAAFADALAGQPVPERTPSEWLDRPWGLKAGLREPGATVTVIRGEDEAAVCAEGPTPAATVTKYSIPMPVHAVMRELSGWPQLGSALIAPDGRIDYSSRWGARWNA